MMDDLTQPAAAKSAKPAATSHVAVATADADGGYRVLARKYRPTTIDALIGQASLVTTLNNALSMGRLAHAFILTGLRGIGKTTTARIIAKGLNCTGKDGKGQPTLNPCGVCESCVGITAGRHVDVIEMDAASNTGVDDIREVIDGVSYAPLSARYKIYIIDEVHMLSKNAFNALLKTLEEPPPSVIFVFATTEIRKVPVTVLSRCQRFDLRRVATAQLADHLAGIAKQESINTDAAALLRIARAAEGSVRDALSLLDQAAALTKDKVTDSDVATMLGQAGRKTALAIAEAVLAGDAVAAMAGLEAAINDGAEPVLVIGDLLEFIHYASRLAINKNEADIGLGDLPEAEAEALRAIASNTSIARLARAWQIAIKGHAEVTTAPNPQAAADMVLIRIAHAANMPPPAELLKKLATTKPAATPTAAPAPTTPQATAEVVAEEKDPPPQDMREMVALFEKRGELHIASILRLNAKPVLMQVGTFHFASDGKVEDEFVGKLVRHLYDWTGLKWAVEWVTNAEGRAGETLDALDKKHQQRQEARVDQDAKIRQARASFPNITIASITPLVDSTDAPAEADQAGDTEGEAKVADAGEAGAGTADDAAETSDGTAANNGDGDSQVSADDSSLDSATATPHDKKDATLTEMEVSHA